MAFERTSRSSSSSQSVVAPQELLSVLKILSEKQKKVQQQRQQCQRHDQLANINREDEEKQGQQYMEWSQIELIYRAEGNANLVLALPQFKKVLRLPKISIQHRQRHETLQAQPHSSPSHQIHSQHHEKGKAKKREQSHQQKPNKVPTTGQQEAQNEAVGILTMDHYVAYISIIRCLVGNEFVFEADVVAVPNPTDRHWINERIKPYRPANRLDKEFGGHFGLLLPDATQLPAEVDILLSNLQCKNRPAIVKTTTRTSHCSYSNNASTSTSTSSSSSYSNENSYNASNKIFGADTFAIEIKPKQGWLLPNDVDNLFDIKPKTTEATQTTRTIQPPSFRVTETLLKPAVATTITAAATRTEALKINTDTEWFTAAQNDPSQTMTPAITMAAATTTTTTTKICSASKGRKNESPVDDKTSHSLNDRVDLRCRYCCMQFLKMKQQTISKRSQYCPIDLFSGNNEKMLLALDALFECPQNNLRIFRNGNLVFDDAISRTSTIDDLFSSDKVQLIKHLLVTCLLREYDNKEEGTSEETEKVTMQIQQQLLSSSAAAAEVGRVRVWGGEDGDGSRSSMTAGVAAGQPQPSVTSCKNQTLSTMPKTTTITSTTLTETEVTQVKSTLISAECTLTTDSPTTSTSNYSTRCLEQINKAEVTCLPKNCVLQRILHLQSLAKTNLQFMLDHEYADKRDKTYNIVFQLFEKFGKAQNELTLSQLTPEEQYILAATALDCSVMITFCEMENPPEDGKLKAERSLTDNACMVKIFGKAFLTKVTLLDLDPKPDSHFSKYVHQTKQIMDALKDS